MEYLVLRERHPVIGGNLRKRRGFVPVAWCRALVVATLVSGCAANETMGPDLTQRRAPRDVCATDDPSSLELSVGEFEVFQESPDGCPNAPVVARIHVAKLLESQLMETWLTDTAAYEIPSPGSLNQAYYPKFFKRTRDSPRSLNTWLVESIGKFRETDRKLPLTRYTHFVHSEQVPAPID